MPLFGLGLFNTEMNQDALVRSDRTDRSHKPKFQFSTFSDWNKMKKSSETLSIYNLLVPIFSFFHLLVSKTTTCHCVCENKTYISNGALNSEECESGVGVEQGFGSKGAELKALWGCFIGDGRQLRTDPSRWKAL